MIAGVVVLPLVGAGLWWLADRDGTPEVAPIENGAAHAAPVAAEPPAAPDALDPSRGDELLREKLGEIPGSERWSGWISALSVRRLAAAARLVADGVSPRGPLGFIDVEGDYVVAEEPTRPGGPAGRIFTSPRSHARYDGVAGLIASIDAARLGRLYAELRPYCDAVYAEIAKPGERFDDVLSAAIGRIVTIPVGDGPHELVVKGALYAYANPKLEALSPAAKHLLRMGPKNARAVQGALRRFADAASLPVM